MGNLVQGKGVYKKGKYKAKVDKRHTREYSLWNSMLQRAYDPKYHEKQPSYIDVEVSEELLDFQNYAEIINNMPFYNARCENGFAYEVDKDLFNIEEYSKDTIVFVPKALNGFLTNKQKNKGELPIGVCWHKRDKKYRVQINVDGKRKYLGSFDDVGEAEQCYIKARNDKARELATKYKGLVEDRVIDALMNYDEATWI